jgi:hypothetical protein
MHVITVTNSSEFLFLCLILQMITVNRLRPEFLMAVMRLPALNDVTPWFLDYADDLLDGS